MSTPHAHAPRPNGAGTRPQIHEDEVLTGEAVALDVQPIGLILRAAGSLIDLVTYAVLYIGFVWAANELLRIGVIPAPAVRIASIVLLVIVFVCIPVTVETATKGRSLGKLAVGARIVRGDGGSIGFRHAFIRGILGVLEIVMTVGSLAVIVGMFTPRAQRLGDLAAGTYAERTRTPKLPDVVPLLPPGMEGWASVADVARVPDRAGRRMNQFVSGAAAMFPPARARVAAELAAELAPFVSPMPVGDPESVVRAIAAVRRERELRALSLETERVAQLTR
ncbi:RDD family protein [Microbacterium halotolerans]|uniref:RDD family protein n=1 Tax=Microbacterium halotolerans TaxID=246613 RepID=UPI000E6A9D87|nr:RDD family protein [Microbacterium halotolerans]